MTSHPMVRWGILGAARINERMLPALLGAENSELVAIASRREGAALETLERYAPGTRQVATFNTLDALLARRDIDAVYIPLSNSEHAEWTLKALESGKHVLCEKPMALKVSDIERILLASQRTGLKVMEGFMYRFHPQHERVDALIASGLIGDIRSVRTCFSFLMKPARRYRIESSLEEGGGACWDIGCYALHAARLWLRTAPLSLQASMYCAESGADLSTSGVIDYGQGIRAHFEFGFDTTRRSQYLITGTKGIINCPTVWQLPGDTPKISWETEDGQSGMETLTAHNHFELEITAFSKAILNDEPPPLSLEDALENCRLLNAVIESAKSGRRVYLSN